MKIWYDGPGHLSGKCVHTPAIDRLPVKKPVARQGPRQEIAENAAAQICTECSFVFLAVLLAAKGDLKRNLLCLCIRQDIELYRVLEEPHGKRWKSQARIIWVKGCKLGSSAGPRWRGLVTVIERDAVAFENLSEMSRGLAVNRGKLA
jgi:hypothetical protein